MKDKFIHIIIGVGLIATASAFPSKDAISKLSKEDIVKTAVHLSSLVDDAQAQVVTAKKDLSAVQAKYDVAAKKISDLEDQVAKYRLEAHNNAKQRDVVVFAFAIFFSLWFGSLFSGLLSSLPQPWGTFAPWVVYIVGLGLGYSLGRYILSYLSHFIP
jgi:hypothetical protein